MSKESEIKHWEELYREVVGGEFHGGLSNLENAIIEISHLQTRLREAYKYGQSVMDFAREYVELKGSIDDIVSVRVDMVTEQYKKEIASLKANIKELKKEIGRK